MALRLIAFLLLALVLLVLAHIRFSASDPAKWHIDPETAADPGTRGVLRQHDTAMPPASALARFDAIAMAAPRVTRLAGSVNEGRLTYVVRSKWIGFPDYVTVSARNRDGGAALTILSRLRFGGSDLGVNAARLEDWLQRFDAGTD